MLRPCLPLGGAGLAALRSRSALPLPGLPLPGLPLPAINRPMSFLSRGSPENINQDVEKIAQVIDSCNSIVVMSGAGLSTASGIPDFRSPNTGIYANLAKFKLPYPEALFELEYFRKNPRAFNTWAKEFYPGENFLPNKAHYFLKVLENKGKLSRVFTQNIDGLEQLAGLTPALVVEAHGTFSTAACIECGKEAGVGAVKEAIMVDQDAKCSSCGGWVKPGIVFFGEALPKRFFEDAEFDCLFCDQLICVGTSLEVYPFAGIVDAPKHQTPRLLVNHELVGSLGSRPADSALLGDIVRSVEKICERLEWTDDLLEVQLENELAIKD